MSQNRITKSAFVVVTILLILLNYKTARADNGHYYVDFGSATFLTLNAGWNNWADNRDQSSTLTLIDSIGATTGVTLSLPDQFVAGLGGGVCTAYGSGGASNIYPLNATRDSFAIGNFTFINAACVDIHAEVEVKNLNPLYTYSFRMYASRTEGATSSRYAIYKIGNATTTLNASNNVDNYAELTVYPSATGTVRLLVDIAPGTSYAQLGVLEVIQNITNLPPIVDVGPDFNLGDKYQTFNLSASSSDPDGTIVTYQWEKIAGPNATIVSPNSSSTSIVDYHPGTYTFKMTVTDDDNFTASDTVTITVGLKKKKIVILGSSTSFGLYADAGLRWTDLFTNYFKTYKPDNEVINLAVAGFNTYSVMPTSYTPPGGRSSPSVNANITYALAQNPDAIIVNLPTNDAANGYSEAETESNFQTIYNLAASSSVPMWISTTQPRDTLTADQMTNLVNVKNWIISNFNNRYLDFWTTLADSNGHIATIYANGDGVHFNNAGHNMLYQRAASSSLVETLYPADINNVNSSTIDNSVTLSWDTSKLANSKVKYGLTSSLGSESPINESFQINHSVNIANLEPNSDYYYQVYSVDDIGNVATSNVRMFRTANRAANDVIVMPVPAVSAGGFYILPSQSQGKITKVESNATHSNTQPSSSTKTLKMGVKHNLVISLQKKLNSLNFIVAKAGPGSKNHETDTYGTLTKLAVKKFQISRKISPADGIVGPKTRKALGL